MPNSTTARRGAGGARSLCAFTILVSLAITGAPSALQAEEPAALKGHEWPISSAVFSRDGKLLATGDSHGNIKLWDVATMKERASITAHAANVWSLSFSPDGKVLASGGGCQERNDKGFMLWDVASGMELPGLEGQKGTVSAVAFSPDGKTVAFIDAANLHLRFWDVEAKKVRSSIEAPGFETLAYSPDGKALALGGGGGRVKVWEVATGKELREFKADSTRVRQVRYTADGKGILLVNFYGNSAIQLWEPEEKRDKVVVTKEGDLDHTVLFALAPKDKAIATVTRKGLLQLRDPKTWEVLATVQADDKYAHALTFSPDGGTVVTGGSDHVVKLWDVAKLMAKKSEK